MRQAVLLRWFASCVVLCVFCYYYVDRPVAEFAAHRIDVHHWLLRLCQALAAPSLLSLPFGLCFLALRAMRVTKPAWKLQDLLTQLSVAIILATAAKDFLKWVFGRPWPEAFISFGTYEFSPLNNGLHYGSFPSGHTSYISAPLFIISYYYPHLRWPCCGVIGMVMIGLVGGGYHFPGDTVAGLLTGLLAASGTLALMQPKMG